MISDGIENCLQYLDNFNPKTSNNPFAYFTQIIYYAFIRRIQKEKKQITIKQRMIQESNYDDLGLTSQVKIENLKTSLQSFLKRICLLTNRSKRKQLKRKKRSNENSLVKRHPFWLS
ncbi:MAG: hypothetical protein CM15mV27_1030 [Caudoviricetes sp.]|nr:MAG: hypothetical protein CM15mV27_1030 [Caudoviricetes sp.]